MELTETLVQDSMKDWIVERNIGTLVSRSFQVLLFQELRKINRCKKYWCLTIYCYIFQKNLIFNYFFVITALELITSYGCHRDKIIKITSYLNLSKATNFLSVIIINLPLHIKK